MIEILGSSVSALVATERLMTAGVDVRRTPTGRPCGFGYRELPDGRKVENGCRLLELSYEPLDELRVPPPLADFASGDGHRPWIASINEYVRGLIDVGPEVERVAVRDQYSVPDPFLSGDPTEVRELLTEEECDDVIFQISQVVGRTFWKRAETYAEAARVNCGETVYEALIWPLVNKIAGWTDVPASQHRKLWLPSWHSQSLLDALRGESSYRPVRPMHFGCGALYEALEAVTKDALTVGHDETYALMDAEFCGAPKPPSVPIGVAWIADEHAPGVEWLIDADDPVFRRTWRGDDICCVEYAAGANIDRWCYDQGHDLLDKAEVRVPIGDVVCDDPRAIGYGSLNDQIVQGLAVADRLIREGRA